MEGNHYTVEAVSKRYGIKLPDAIASALERLAASEGNKPTTLASFLVERSIRDLLEKGKIPPQNAVFGPPQKTAGDSGNSVIPAGVATAMKKLIDGEPLTPEEEELIAEACDRAPHNVHNASKKIRSKNGNGQTTVNR